MFIAHYFSHCFQNQSIYPKKSTLCGITYIVMFSIKYHAIEQQKILYEGLKMNFQGNSHH
jgi:hypothetical protein